MGVVTDKFKRRIEFQIKMPTISVTRIPKPEDRKAGKSDLIIGWFPKPLLPIEEKVLLERGAKINTFGDNIGYLVEGYPRTLLYEKTQELKEHYLELIKRNPNERLLAVYHPGKTSQ